MRPVAKSMGFQNVPGSVRLQETAVTAVPGFPLRQMFVPREEMMPLRKVENHIHEISWLRS